MNYYKLSKNMTGVRMLVLCLLMTVCTNIFFPVPGFSRKKQQNPVMVYGTVRNDQGLPVMGAFITVQESTSQAVSGEDGSFEIKVPKLNSLVTIEAEGFERYSFSVLDDSRVNIVLKYSIEGQGINDKVNMPWLTTDKRRLTASVSTVNYAELRKSPVMRLNQALSGRLPGLTVVSGSAFPGDESGSWRIRGIRTLEEGGSNNMEKGSVGEPITIVDGFERSFKDLDASEIETISVLKDAAATAIYGTRAANGVILVTTKRGQANRRTIDVEFTAGVVRATNLPDFLPADQYAFYHNEARRNDGLPELYDEKDMQFYRDGSSPLTHPDIDWYKEFVSPVTHQLKGSLTMSGGNRIVRYFVSLAYNNQGGLYEHLGENPEIETKMRYSRYNARANVDVQLFKRLSASFNLSGRIEDRRYPYSSGTTMFDMFSSYPSNAFPLYFYGVDPALNKEIFMLGGNTLYRTNPLGELSHRGSYENTKRYYQAGLQLHHDMDYLTKGLRANFEFNADGYAYLLTRQSKNYRVWEPVYGSDNSVSYKSYNSETTLARAWDGATITSWSGLNLNFTYDRTFGDHAVNGLLMYRQFRTVYTQTNQPDRKIQDFVFRGSYGFKNRYFLDVTLNYSGTDNFYLTNTPRMLFPAVSGAWIISDEPWLKESSWIDFLKLRASWGITGNDEYTFTDKYSGSSLKYRYVYRNRWWSWANSNNCWGTGRTWSKQVVREGVLPNQDFKIEKAMMTNIGLDATFLDHKLSFGADFFYENRYDIYTRSAGSLPLVVGVVNSNLPIMNSGEVHSKGFEFSLGWNQTVGDFSYWVNGYVDYSTNKIINMDEPYKEDPYRVETGGSVRQNYGLIALGLFKNQAEIDSSPVQTFGPYQPGDIKYADLNGDNIIDANDYTRIGKPTFPELGVSLDLGFRYKNFDFSALFQGAFNRSHYLNNNAMRAFYDNGNISKYALNRYTDEASWATATYPRLTTISNDNNWRISTFWMKNASYLRLKNLELGYNVPAKFARKMGMYGFRVYFNAYNVFSIDNMDGMDPEDPTAGIGSYPQIQIFNFGLNFKF